MGFYINTTPSGKPLPTFNKAAALNSELPLTKLSGPPKTLPTEVGLLCEVGFALGHVYSQEELEEFSYAGDSRPKQWFTGDKEIIFSLSNAPQE